MSTAPAIASRFGDPVARNYLFVGLAAQFVVVAAVLARPGSNLVAAAFPAALAALGLLIRLTAMPYIFLIVLCYLLAVPTLTPYAGHVPTEVTRLAHFRLVDLVLAAAVLVYFAAHFRLLGLTDRAVPGDVPPHLRKKGERPVRRPGSIAPPGEFGRLFAVLGACVVAAQLAWLLLAEFHVDLRGNPPLTLGDSVRVRFWDDPLLTSDAMSRFLLLAGLWGFSALAAALVFWYWRLSRLGPEQAGMLLLDTGWRETRPDLSRQEKWRARAANRSAAPRPKAERPRRWSAAVIAAGVAVGVIAFLCMLAFCLWANRLY